MDTEALATVLTELSERPFDFTLHTKHISLVQSSPNESASAMEMMANFIAVGDEVWLPLIAAKRAAVDVKTANGVGELLALYEKAEADYLSIPILKDHFEFILAQYSVYAEGDSKPSELGDIFSQGWTRSALLGIANKATGHLTQSKVLWDQLRDWELETLEAASDSEKQELADHVEQLLLGRLGQPHSNSDETSQAYSSFTTNYKPPGQYESLMVAASKTRSKLAKAYERREPLEMAIVQSNFSLEVYARYATYERRSKYPDILVMSTVYERAIAEAAKRRFQGEVGAEEVLRTFWTGYCDALRITNAGEDVELDVLKRAIRSVPASGEVWSRYIRHLERFMESDNADEYSNQISVIYNQAFSTNLLQSDVEQIVPVTLARAGFERRRFEASDSDSDIFATLVAVLENGIDMVQKASRAGDARLRLERFLADVYRSQILEDHVLEVWQAATKHYKASYLPWTLYTEALIAKKDFDTTRSTFKFLVYKQLDWPQAIWEAWLGFEHLHGSVEEVETCLDTIEQAQYKLNTQLAKEATSYQASQMVVDPQPQEQTASEQPMDIDQPRALDRGVKRPAEDSRPADVNKKARIDPPLPPLKRDRENCTVFVASLPPDVTEDDLTQLFKDCGKIREVKISTLSSESLVATIEFFERGSVPQALTKDKKRLKGEEIAVHLAWQSTLYITNFPETADDAFIRNLFGKYGTIFDVRWPSKKFKSTRRFCYLQYTSPSSAQSALELHGTELQPDLALNVLISNPERKKDRSDRDANDREIYVAGLARHTNQADLEKLFKTYGSIKEVRMALDRDGTSKGFAFIEFENEQDASAALQANNYELKKRRIAVTLSDSRAKGKNSGGNTETRTRSVRVCNLPASTQEGLLQQALERIAKVKRVEVFSEKNEAVVELESVAEAGKLLLRSDPVVFNDNTLQFSEEIMGPARDAVAAAGMFVPRTAATRPRAGIGHKKKPVTISPQVVPKQQIVPSVVPSQGKGQDDFRKMLGNS